MALIFEDIRDVAHRQNGNATRLPCDPKRGTVGPFQEEKIHVLRFQNWHPGDFGSIADLHFFRDAYILIYFDRWPEFEQSYSKNILWSHMFSQHIVEMNMKSSWAWWNPAPLMCLCLLVDGHTTCSTAVEVWVIFSGSKRMAWSTPNCHFRNVPYSMFDGWQTA